MIKTTMKQLLDPNYLQNKSFDRLRVALANQENMVDSVAYNIVDSVIYINNPSNLDTKPGYKAIYNTVIINNDEECIDVELGDKLNSLENYDDVSDFGVGQVNTTHSINKGEVLIIETYEPYKINFNNQKLFIAYVSKYSGIK